jgi:hypothetical protein
MLVFLSQHFFVNQFVVTHLQSPIEGIALAKTLLCFFQTKPMIQNEYERKTSAEVNQTENKKLHGIDMPMELCCT